MSDLLVYLLVGGAVVCIWVLGLTMCVVAGRSDRAIDKHAQERAARDALRSQRNVVALPRKKPPA